MLRALILVLLAANVAFFAWTQGWMSPALLPPMSSEREPERLARQVRPETIEFVGPEAVEQARRAEAAARAASAASEARPASAQPAAR